MMGTVWTVLRHQVRDVLRGRAVVGTTLFFALATWGLVHFGGSPDRALPSLATMIVLVVPLVSLLVTTTYVYNSTDFIELVLSQPVGRRPYFAGLWLGLALPLAGAFVLGMGVPLVASSAGSERASAIVLLALAGTLLTTVFASIGLLVALRVPDAAKGAGLALLIWLGFAVLYDGAVLFAAYRWAAYPLETPMLVLMALNPVDVARVLVLMALDASALMGYTGAVFQDFFGGRMGLLLSLACLVAWTAIPAWAALRTFQQRDF